MTTTDVPIIGADAGEGFLQTIPSWRFWRPDEVADAALYLASGLASYVNSESRVVDSGLVNVG